MRSTSMCLFVFFLSSILFFSTSSFALNNKRILSHKSSITHLFYSPLSDDEYMNGVSFALNSGQLKDLRISVSLSCKNSHTEESYMKNFMITDNQLATPVRVSLNGKIKQTFKIKASHDNFYDSKIVFTGLIAGKRGKLLTEFNYIDSQTLEECTGNFSFNLFKGRE